MHIYDTVCVIPPVITCRVTEKSPYPIEASHGIDYFRDRGGRDRFTEDQHRMFFYSEIFRFFHQRLTCYIAYLQKEETAALQVELNRLREIVCSGRVDSIRISDQLDSLLANHRGKYFIMADVLEVYQPYPVWDHYHSQRDLIMTRLFIVDRRNKYISYYGNNMCANGMIGRESAPGISDALKKFKWFRPPYVDDRWRFDKDHLMYPPSERPADLLDR